MSWSTEGLSPEELRRYRSVQRKRHGLRFQVYSLQGQRFRTWTHPLPERTELRLNYMVDKIRIIFEIDGHEWAEVHAGQEYNTRSRGKVGGWAKMWAFNIPLP